MKKGKAVAALLTAVLSFAFAMGCSAKAPDAGPQSMPAESEAQLYEQQMKPQSTPQSETNAKTMSTVKPSMELNGFLGQVQTLARYFSEPIKSTEELRENPELCSFLVNSARWMCKESGKPLKNQVEQEWDPLYELPAAQVKSLARAMLGIEMELPQKWLDDPELGYQKDLDAFVYEPTDPTLMKSHGIDYSIHEDGTAEVVVRLAPFEVINEGMYNRYCFKTVDDPDWGKVYQLSSIERLEEPSMKQLDDGGFFDFLDDIVPCFEEPVFSAEDILKSPMLSEYLINRTIKLGNNGQDWPVNESQQTVKIPKEAIQKTALRELRLKNYDCRAIEEWEGPQAEDGVYNFGRGRCSSIVYRMELQKLMLDHNEVTATVYLKDTTNSPVLPWGLMEPEDRMRYRFEMLPNGEGWRFLSAERIGLSDFE